MKNSIALCGLRYAITLFVGLTLLPMLMNAQDKGTFTDSRDGRVYNWTKVGAQVWMSQNLDFNSPAASWAYNSDSANEVSYGRLYTWKAAQVACPKGWHLPSDKEWGVLVQSLGGNSMAGQKMQAMDTVGKNHGPAGSATAGAISSLLSGVRHADGSCIGIATWGGCWTSGKVNDSVGNNMLFAKGAKDLVVSSNDKNSGFAVRCIRNK